MQEAFLFVEPQLIRQIEKYLAGSGDPGGINGRSVRQDLPDGASVEAIFSLMATGDLVLSTTLRPANAPALVTSDTTLAAGASPLTSVQLGDGEDATLIFLCTDTVTLEVPAPQADWLQGLFDGTDHEDCKSGTPLYKLSTQFGGGMEVDLTVVQSDSDETPWIDATLFSEGTEAMTLEPDETLFGEHPFEFDGRTYTVHVVRGRDLGAHRPRPQTRRPGAHDTWL